MARTIRTEVKFKRNRETVIDSPTKARRRDRTFVIEQGKKEFDDIILGNADAREQRYEYGGV